MVSNTSLLKELLQDGAKNGIVIIVTDEQSSLDLNEFTRFHQKTF